jgi:3-hydroxyisobutyrate dehydrogenase
MSKIAVLGLGAMGARMATNLVQAGHAVTVWNRSAERAKPLVDAGAQGAATPRAAVAGTEVVIAMVRDDEASREVWLAPQTGALDGMTQGAIAIESSTLTPGWVKQLARAAEAAGVPFIDAPVAGSRPQAEAGQLIYMIGGDAGVIACAEPILRSMGGTLHFAGPVGSGALVKLAVNTLFAVQVATVAELIGALKANGTDVARAVEILFATPAASIAAKGAAASMLSDAFAPMFPVELVEKDLGYVTSLVAEAAKHLPMAAAARGVMQNAIAAGLGQDNLTGIARLYR